MALFPLWSSAISHFCTLYKTMAAQSTASMPNPPRLVPCLNKDPAEKGFLLSPHLYPNTLCPSGCNSICYSFLHPVVANRIGLNQDSSPYMRTVAMLPGSSLVRIIYAFSNNSFLTLPVCVLCHLSPPPEASLSQCPEALIC